MPRRLLIDSLIALFSSLPLVAIAPNVLMAASSDTVDNGTVVVDAKLTYLQDGGFLRDLRIQITRDRQMVTSAAIPVQQLPNYNKRYGFKASDADVIILDLDSNGEPEVIVDVAEAKNNCCSSSFIYSYNPQLRQYQVRTQFWGNYNSGYWLSIISRQEGDRKLADLDNDGFGELVAFDDRFRDKFGSIATSYAPIQIWRYQEGQLKNVTKEFPYPLYLSAADSLEAYQSIRSQYGAEQAKSAMAAYVAAMYLLGQQDEARQQLQQGYGDSSSGQRFITQLMTFLKQTGYIY